MHFNRIQGKRPDCVLVRSMEMRPVVRGTNFREHANDDSEESRQFRHRRTLHRLAVVVVGRVRSPFRMEWHSSKSPFSS
jgi:hypothetical protein